MSLERTIKIPIWNKTKKIRNIKGNEGANDSSYHLCFSKNPFNLVLKVASEEAVLISRLNWVQTGTPRYEKLWKAVDKNLNIPAPPFFRAHV